MPRSVSYVGAVAVLLAAAGVWATEPAETVVKPAVQYAAVPLPLTEVRLTGGPLKVAQDLDRDYLLKLEPDRMLAYLRERAGLPRKAVPYGGWDGSGRQLTGHIAGHYLSAISYMYQATGDQRFKERVDYIVAELKLVQDKRGTGYVGALLGNAPTTRPATAPTSTTKKAEPVLMDGELLFDQLSEGQIRSSGFDLNGMWSPWYVEHKLYAGLRDAYRLTGNKTALEVEVRFAAWAEKLLAPLSDEQIQKMLNTEFGGMNEVFVDLYADTGDQRWLALARKFNHKRIVDPLSEGKDSITGTHGNTQIPKLIGSLAEYLYTGDAAAGKAARTFWDAVVSQYTFASGGHGYDEYFGKAGRLSGQVDGTGQRSQDLRTAETCNIYNMLKLTRRLFALAPDVRYADYHERALFNHILASINPKTGQTCYMVPVGPGVQHEYQDMLEDFTCCVGTGMESHALHGYGLYYTAGDRLWVNLYSASTAQWKAAGVELKMETEFPLGESATLKLGLKTAKQLTLSFRRPAWAGEGFVLKVNGEVVQQAGQAGGYVDVTRVWSDGDVVTISLPKLLRTEPLPDNPSRVAVMWGPLVLAGDFGQRVPNTESAPIDFPVFPYADRSLTDWLRPVEGKPGTFKATLANGKEITLAPFYTVHDRRYSTYWDLFTPAQWAERQAIYLAEQARRNRLAAATVAYVQLGEMQPERDFNFQGEGSATLRTDGQPGRTGGKWVSVDVSVNQPTKLFLAITTLSAETQPELHPAINGVQLAQIGRQQEANSRFADVVYEIPAALLTEKSKVTIRLQATEGKTLSAVYGLRVLREAPGDAK